ncbi:heme ABC exporter ATP-binding protein CcmA [Xinfangfangia sp. D13-10-4-6]|uniref:heme ABC exporter ATP-binding protein CcmA n=1 Tax=Pseudogemmobacter hezensis TaxID=2737662 RepID=UPI0015564D6D|nr:heme ABC exporter ATP-binding protein CcmA [Pseudogemmobacter hezensis]NPD15325.1 heme ABC exporter ATP-binding protein CcmA [Pseudogemmobacter hezensis]
MLLTVRDLAVSRGGLIALSKVSFALAPGRTLVLRGANGIGKTTLLRTIAGLQPAAAGQIEAASESIAYASHADGVKLALSVSANLSFWSAIFGTGKAATAEAMQRMNLTSLADRPAARLSAGQKRRLGLARMLVTGRPVWLLDEPTVSLDQESVALFADVLRDHLGAGGAALIATHIDLGLPEAAILDLTPYRTAPHQMATPGFDDAFGDAFSDGASR